MAGSGRGRRSGVSISLGVKALIGGALLLLLSSAAIGFAALSVTHAEMRRAFETRVEFVLETTAQGMASHLRPGAAPDEIDRALQAPVRTDGVLFCACFGSDGRLVGFRGVPEFDEPLAPRLAQLGPADAASLALTTRRGERVRLRMAPVIARAAPEDAAVAEGAERDAGTLLLGCTDSPIEAEFAPVRRRVGTIVVGIAAVTALLAWLVARMLVRPIHQLVAGTQRIARGEFDHRVQVRGHDEFGLLAQSFNAMTKRLAQSRDELAEQREVLERTVLERTRKLRDAYAELKVLDKMKDGFLSTISHELRTPITSIRAFAELLQQDPALDTANRQEFAGIILKESEHLNHLVTDVLDLVTIESGDVSFRFARAQPLEVVRAAAEAVAPHAKGKEIAIEIAAAPELPSVLWDGAKVTRMLHELLDNAVRFSSRGGRTVVTIARAGELVRVEVRDDGPGIPECDLEAVFARFHQCGEVLTGKPQGQGLGLAICRLIAQRHGGSVRAVASTRGAHMVVDLPVAPPAREPDPRPDAASLAT